ncbi:MAG: SdrD B-like domain-containing protein [Gemmatimonadales bacterium]
MLRRNLLAGMALLVATSVSCNNNDIPAGTAGTVTVRVFVDADGSGDYSDGDVVFTAAVTLTTSSGAVRGASTDAQGEAVFNDVAPGSYTASISGTVPDGAVLATASQPIIVVPFKGGDVSGQFRYVFNPGAIHGVIYRDENGNSMFDAGVDTPAPGLPVAVIPGTDASAEPVATTTTDANGAFSFPVLRPGTYTVLVTPIPTIQLVGGNTRTVDVTAAATTEAAVRFTGNLLTPLAQVRTAAPGTIVAFVAVATQNAGLLASNNLYVQDASAGVLVFGAPTAGILAGDTVRVVGAVSSFNGELEIAAPSGGTLTVTKLGSGPVPAPRTITVPQLNSGDFAGQLVTVTGVKVVSVATTGATSYNVNLQGSNPADVFQVRIGNTNNVPIPSTFWVVGHSYDVTGLDGVFNGAAQLKPRSAADVVPGASTLPIATAKLNLNDTVTVVGVVTAGRGTFRTDNGYIQDSTSGVQIFNLPSNLTINLGDTVRVHGKMVVFSGENEIENNAAPADSIRVTVIGSGPAPLPRVVTGTEFAARTFEGELVKLADVTIVTVGTASGSGTYTVTGTAEDGTAVTIFMSAPTGSVPPPATTYTVGHQYDIAGIASVFTSTAELKPRGAADVTPAPATVLTIAAAKGVSNDTVTVEGVVTAGQGIFRTDNSYIQDASSGVQIFNLPAALMLQVGDAVRVHGKMVVFGGENEIENNIAITDSIKVTRLGTGSVAPRVVTGAQFAARTFEGQLVTLQDVTILTVGTAGGTGTYTVTGTAADATPVTIFMSAPTGNVPAPAATYTVGSHYNVTGIASVFSSAAELKPRGAGDVVPR